MSNIIELHFIGDGGDPVLPFVVECTELYNLDIKFRIAEKVASIIRETSGINVDPHDIQVRCAPYGAGDYCINKDNLLGLIRKNSEKTR